MAKSSSSQKSPEEYVKNYQLDITNSKLDAVMTGVETLQKQVSDFQLIMQTRPTTDQVDDKIAVAMADLRKDIDTSNKEIRLEFGPAVKTSNRLLWGILSSGLALLVSLFMIIVGVFTK